MGVALSIATDPVSLQLGPCKSECNIPFRSDVNEKSQHATEMMISKSTLRKVDRLAVSMR
ncbi:hypothetical protein NECAME_07468 [Necator americanus]|uniref:Uncharacterized protein n=1 Tax=Necator americanus TaxID=51031 RepID=W2TMG2_NECAM|nr:hypothetical protein NECAME_07468 [Necator americanus]ETN83280.1 hypothetical protein NECAME_07468 [Necator americanus]